MDYTSNASTSSEQSSPDLIPSLDEPFIDNKMITEMFDSLYQNDILSSDNSSSPEASLYSDLLSYTPKLSIPSVSVKNPIVSSFREIFFAKGCSYLSKTNSNSEYYAKASENHYSNAIKFINDISSKNEDNWLNFSIDIICKSDRLLDFFTENSILNSIRSFSSPESENVDLMNCPITILNKVLLNQALVSYPLYIYFMNDNQLMNLESPNIVFKKFSQQILDTLINNPCETENWLENVVKTTILNILQNLTKLIYLLRTKQFMTEENFNSNLKVLKSDISLIWTTIQTAEIQLEYSNCLIEFAKFFHMSLEIFFIKLSDSSVNLDSQIIKFYLDQSLVSLKSFQSYPKSETGKICQTYLILPLFILSCSTDDLNCKQDLVGELLKISGNLNLKLVEKISNMVLDGNKDFFNGLIERSAFADLVN